MNVEETSALLSALPAEYELTNPDGTAIVEGQIPELLGSGGSSVVVRAHFRRSLPRAIKVLTPREDLKDTVDTGRFVESFANEIALLSRLTHQNVSKLTDFGSVTDGEQAVEHPYVVTEFIDGDPADSFASNALSSGEDIFSILQQVLSALEYLHSENVMHCDVKPANVLVRRIPGSIQAVLVDLGVSRSLDVVAGSDPTRTYTYFFSSTSYVMPSLVPYLANLTQNRIPLSELKAAFPSQDLHAFGTTLEKLYQAPNAEEKLRSALGAAGLAALKEVRRRLHIEDPRRPFYASAAAVQDALARIPITSISPLDLRELAAGSPDQLSIPTPRRRIPLTERAERLVNHPVFQRLHHVPQLDLLQHVLPGARNSRFLHALHTFDLSRSAITSLVGDWRVRLDVPRDQAEAVLFTALLKDVGQYQFLHMFEDFVAERKQPAYSHAGLLNREEIFNAIIGAPGEASTPAERAVADFASNVTDHRGTNFAELCSDLLDTSLVDAQKWLRQPQDELESLLAGLLSSPVDVDKLAYLEDDAISTGMSFGRALDAEAIFSALMVPQWSDIVGANQAGKPCVGVREGVLSYLENAVLARYWHIQRGYWHRTNRSLQAMVKYVLGRLLESDCMDFPGFFEETFHFASIESVRWLSNKFELARSTGRVPDSVNPLSEIVLSQRRIYKRLITISPKSRLASREQDHKIYSALARMSPEDERNICSAIAGQIQTRHPGIDVKEGEILLDIPRRRREEFGGRALVYSDDADEFLAELFQLSPVLDDLYESFDLYAKRARIFIHPRVADALDTPIGEERLRILDYLRGEYGER